MIAQNILKIKQELGENVDLVVVSKYRNLKDIQTVYDSGIRNFAENRVQPLLDRTIALPSDIQWHIIGHLQTNKVKYIVPFIHLIQSVDSLKLMTEINFQAKKHNRIIDCLLQIYIAQEDTKFGFTQEELLTHIENGDFNSFENINIKGLMGMASNTENKEQIESEFKGLSAFFNELKNQPFFKNKTDFSILSMGMSSDYSIAIASGSNMVRIGSLIFE